MAAYKMAAVKVTPPNDFPLGLIRLHMVVIHLFLMLCGLQRVVRDLCTTLYIAGISQENAECCHLQVSFSRLITIWNSVKRPAEWNSLSLLYY